MSTDDFEFGSDSERSDAEFSVYSTVDEVECDRDEAELAELEAAADNSYPEGPYMNEPLADDEWNQEYNREAERKNEVLQNRFDGTEGLEIWCRCGHCALNRLQNAGECLCCTEIEKCVESLGSEAVLREVETPPICITLHPGFIAVCLNRWSLRSAAGKYKTIDGRKYRQSGSEEKFLRGVAYREFTQLIHGFLGGKRIPLSACAYHAIRVAFSVENE